MIDEPQRPRVGKKGAIRPLVLLYGAVAYSFFVVTALYALGFLADAVVYRTIDDGPTSPWEVAVAVDLVLLSLFALQHSGMARVTTKQWLARFVPRSVERSTYVLVTSVVLMVIFTQWRPLPAMVWEVDAEAARVGIWAVYGAGWTLVIGSTFLIDHLDLFGLRQVYLRARQRPYQPPAFRMPWLHRAVRHPLMTGFVIAFWATPTMTAGHALFAGVMTGYILVGVRLEERDLRAAFPDYAAYAASTPRFVPRLHRRIRSTSRPTSPSESRTRHGRSGDREGPCDLRSR